ncbi:putative catalase-3 [Venustampulla echinocandica]|uniref:Catalase n=1 Tax=Venustampulla echinocandica TaxID=2656787 RepID=A0A370TLB8_9HELO|nr:putative catalase-3 [Venustampulla echinocandica]RDL36326.1 putative catalase-3 [Venustampulla echinocandica]
MRSFLYLSTTLATAMAAGCPYMSGQLSARDKGFAKRQAGDSVEGTTLATQEFLAPFELNDTNVYMTTDSGTPIDEAVSLKAGPRGPTLLEDFIFRQKLQRFDHERIPERPVHARGAGAHGVFTSYGDFSNVTAASFLSKAGKQTPMFTRMSTVIGERGSVDSARDVHGMATRFYTDEGNFDIVGINVPVFFINDAILFPDLIHALKPSPDNQIPQAATAHDSAYDFFSQETSALNLVMIVMAGYGIPRSYRHMDGWGVHTYRLVTSEGASKLVRWHWKSLQGKASFLWEEAQAVGGKNSDFHRQDMWNAIEAGVNPEWELGVQIFDENEELAFGFDVLDPTKFIPEEVVPITPLGKMTLNTNPKNYFAETEQIGFQPGHIVRGIDFSDDPVLQGRLYSYLDAQLNRYGGPNFEQAPVNRPRVPIHNNNRDGKAQAYIPTNIAAYSPNTLNFGSPMEANETVGNGFFTAPNRYVSGALTRELSPTFADHWSQPRMVWNSLSPEEQQIAVNALRFETSHVVSVTVKQNFINQMNRIDHDLAVRVAQVLVDVTVPPPDTTYYNNNKTSYISIFHNSLPTIQGLNFGILASVYSNQSMSQAAMLSKQFADLGLFVSVVAENLAPGVNLTYSAADAIDFDGILVTPGSESIFLNGTSPLYPLGRPLQIVQSAYVYGKPVGALGGASMVFQSVGIAERPGVYFRNSTATLLSDFEAGLKTFKFLDRFPLDPPVG